MQRRGWDQVRSLEGHQRKGSQEKSKSHSHKKVNTVQSTALMRGTGVCLDNLAIISLIDEESFTQQPIGIVVGCPL